MTSIVRGLALSVGASAIVGAIVAGGLVYLSTERVNRGLRTDLVSANKSLLEYDEALIGAITELLAVQKANTAALSAQIETLKAEIAAIPAPQIAMPQALAPQIVKPLTPLTPLAPLNTPDDTLNPIRSNDLGDLIKIVPAPTTPEE